LVIGLALAIPGDGQVQDHLGVYPGFQAALDRLRLTAADGAMLAALANHKGRQDLFLRRRPEALDALRTAALVESSESSNRLEGIDVPRARVEGLVLKGAAMRNRSEQEVAGYRDALALIHENAAAMPMEARLLLQLHQRVFSFSTGRGGVWKSANNEIQERDASGRVLRVRFRCLDAVAVPEAMDVLMADIRSALDRQDSDELLWIPLALLDFLCIHPFRDGNGRVGRLLTLLLLYRTDWVLGRYISLERLVEEAREGYYDSLEAASQGWHLQQHDPLPWCRYLWGVLLRGYREFEQHIDALAALRQPDGQSIPRAEKRELVRQACLRQLLPFAVSHIEHECPGISRELIRQVLRQLDQDGRMELRGKGRAALWHPLSGT
jgi:Fic family protein